MDEEKLKDVVINLFNGKYSKKEIIEALAWGEKNTEVFWPLMKEHQSGYYFESEFDPIPVHSFRIVLDLKLNEK